ncbi:MAG: twin-arginine translocation signal domain-containing protein [Alphaproteobacteria bacterium]|nr:twin-arginine translocation signal domain-containing protein [Alphaproteobacteria bacterium]
MSHLNRRRFLQTSSAAGASLLLTGTRASGAVNGASDRVRVAVAGLNGRGQSHISGWMGQSNVEIAYLCDPDANVLASRLKQVSRFWVIVWALPPGKQRHERRRRPPDQAARSGYLHLAAFRGTGRSRGQRIHQRTR